MINVRANIITNIYIYIYNIYIYIFFFLFGGGPYSKHSIMGPKTYSNHEGPYIRHRFSGYSYSGRGLALAA